MIGDERVYDKAAVVVPLEDVGRYYVRMMVLFFCVGGHTAVGIK